MKKLIAFVLVSALILCMYGCEKTKEAEPTDISITEADISITEADISITEGMLDGGADIGVDANS